MQGLSLVLGPYRFGQTSRSARLAPRVFPQWTRLEADQSAACDLRVLIILAGEGSFSSSGFGKLSTAMQRNHPSNQ